MKPKIKQYVCEWDNGEKHGEFFFNSAYRARSFMNKFDALDVLMRKLGLYSRPSIRWIRRTYRVK